MTSTQLVCCYTVGLSVDLVGMSRGMVVLVMNSTRFEVSQTLLRTQMVRCGMILRGETVTVEFIHATPVTLKECTTF